MEIIIEKELKNGLKIAKVKDYSSGFAVINKKGEISHFRLNLINTEFHDGFALVEVIDPEDYSYFTYLTKEGKLLPYSFREAYDFSSKMGRVLLNDGTGWSFVNDKGELLNKRFLKADDFKGKTANITLNSRNRAIIDRSGVVVKEFDYNSKTI